MTKTLLELAEEDCRWPIGRPEWSPGGEQEFCAKRRQSGKPYCLDCCALAYLPAADNATEPERVAA